MEEVTPCLDIRKQHLYKKDEMMNYWTILRSLMKKINKLAQSNFGTGCIATLVPHPFIPNCICQVASMCIPI